ncbi:hypothetical protein [Algoriphagus algorifonticola]|uniref:hypothetical protein n=1 Tax=Algoriphagus algorifonticola TaxID=2593007 RepID=UPI00119E5D10|nr:hypothetical protein [Algoriphagus algorifonticola]
MVNLTLYGVNLLSTVLIWVHSVTLTIKDRDGNVGITEFKVTVVDRISPRITEVKFSGKEMREESKLLLT